jgi:AraC-like DNA-binding protein/quercetin dioxygenase-like cupin family protein
MKMFDSKVNVVVVKSGGYDAIVPHSHEFVELVYIVSGEAENKLGEERIPVKSGDIFVMADRNIQHSLHPKGETSDFSIVNIIFPYDFYQFDWEVLSPKNVFSAEQIPMSKFLVGQIAEEYQNKGWNYEEITYSLTKVLLTHMFRCLPTRRVKRTKTGQSKKQANSYIEIAKRFIHQNYDKQIGVDDVASACGLSKQYLQRLFKREKDTSVIAYIVKYRIQQACRYLLNTDYSVAKVAQLVGFNDLKYFYMQFKKIVGETPIRYKEKFGGRK